MCFWGVCLGWRLDGEGSVLGSLFTAVDGGLGAPFGSELTDGLVSGLIKAE